MTALIRSGLLDLRRIDSKTFSLDHANEAVSHAAANGGPFGMTVIQP